MRVRTAALTILVAAAACFTHPNVDLGPTPPGVSVQATVAYYDVTANSLADLRRALAQEGPSSQGRRWAAITSWRLAWTYQTRRGSLGCEIERTHVRVTTNITFPRWNPTSPPDSSLTAWWDQFNAGLAEHERGHAQLAVKAAGQIVKTFDGMSGSRCDALQQRATDVGTRLSSAMQSEQAEYDAATRHGQTQILKVTRLQTP
jgi:predicted secreted Zn-dependent protease